MVVMKCVCVLYEKLKVKVPLVAFYFLIFLVGRESTFLLALVPVLAQSFFALVSGHLVPFLFLSVWHSCGDY